MNLINIYECNARYLKSADFEHTPRMTYGSHYSMTYFHRAVAVAKISDT